MTAVLLRGGLILDGSGRPGVIGDVLVEDGRIASAGGRISAPGARVVPAEGLAVAPGFIDMHAHSDLAVLTDPDHRAKATQGVTTEVLGQDGLSYAPVTDRTLAVVREQIAGWNGIPETVGFSWRSVAGYLEELDAHPLAVNAAYLLPHGTIRMNVVGLEDRPPTADELERMRAEVDRGMREGAFGLSAGLSYVPGMFAGTDELVELCTVVARHGGFFAPHQRSYGAGALDGYAEMIDVAARSGCALHLTHATMNFDVNRGRAGELLGLVDRAVAGGVDVSLDSYPYLPGSTTLSALLPSWVQAGGPESTLERLRDREVRLRVARELATTGSDGSHGVAVDWAVVQIAGVRDASLAALVGRTIADLARSEGRPPEELYFDLLVRDRLGTTILHHVGDEDNVRAVMRHHRHTGGSDGILVGERPHPRGWGTFPRYLGRYVREEQVLTLEEAIVHLSARPARRLGLRGRGRVASGFVADLVLFDPERVADTATFDDPRRPAEGIPWVFVAGEPVIEDGERTPLSPGRALRHDARHC